MAGLESISTLAKMLGDLNPTGKASSTEGLDATQASSQTSSSNQTVSRVVLDQATVSAAGGQVAQALTTSDVRMEKVAPLQAAIANGTYNVSASAVANKLLEHLLG